MSQLLSNKSQVHSGANPDPLFQDGESAGSGSPMGSGNLVKMATVTSSMLQVPQAMDSYPRTLGMDQTEKEQIGKWKSEDLPSTFVGEKIVETNKDVERKIRTLDQPGVKSPKAGPLSPPLAEPMDFLSPQDYPNQPTATDDEFPAAANNQIDKQKLPNLEKNGMES